LNADKKGGIIFEFQFWRYGGFTSGIKMLKKEEIALRVKTIGKQVLLFIFKTGLRLGLVILPKQFYVPIADILALRRERKRWARPSAMVGVRYSQEPQAELASTWIAPYKAEYQGNRAFKHAVGSHFGPGYGYIEAQALHGVLRYLKPQRIIEVGCGVSTYCMLHAVDHNAKEGGRECKITCIEPYPRSFLRENRKIKLIEHKLQNVSIDTFDSLKAGDFLFIDSSHAVKPLSDVVLIYLEVLPRLKPGVIVHIHDIYFPFTYQRDLLESIFQWQETALLQAFLVNNSKCEVLFSLSQLHYQDPQALQAIFPEYVRQKGEDGLCDRAPPGTHFPSSTYLRML
jgi:predicted O-methyltransferase YrrM